MDFSLIYRSKIIIAAYKDWISASSRVLDIGCGNAVVTDQIRKHFNCSISGTDILDYRKREIPFKIMAEQDKLLFPDGAFDICMLNDMLHHCNHQENLLKEALRVASRVLIFEMEPTIIAKVVDILVNQIHNPAMNKPLNIRTSQNWRDCFGILGLDFEYRKIKKPSWFYPFINFSFKLRRRA